MPIKRLVLVEDSMRINGHKEGLCRKPLNKFLSKKSSPIAIHENISTVAALTDFIINRIYVNKLCLLVMNSSSSIVPDFVNGQIQ